MCAMKANSHYEKKCVIFLFLYADSTTKSTLGHNYMHMVSAKRLWNHTTSCFHPKKSYSNGTTLLYRTRNILCYLFKILEREKEITPGVLESGLPEQEKWPHTFFRNGGDLNKRHAQMSWRIRMGGGRWIRQAWAQWKVGQTPWGVQQAA